MRKQISLFIAGALFLSLSAPVQAATPTQKATNVQVTAVGVESGELSVSWTVPDSFDGIFVSYVAILKSGGVEVKRSVVLESDRTSSFLFSGLINGQVYEAEVVTNYDEEVSLVVASTGTAKPYDVPKAPAKPTITRTAPSEILVDWEVPENNGNEISLYTVTCNPSCSGSTLTSVHSQLEITGLDSETSYTATVIARNERGPSVASVASNGVIPHAEVVAPENLVITPGDQHIAGSWSTANIPGATVTGYLVGLFRESEPGVAEQTVEVTSTSVTFTGLANDVSYFYKVSTKVGLLTSAPRSSFSGLTAAPVVVIPEVPPAVIPVQPVVPVQPKLGVKKKIAAKSLATQIGMTLTPKAKIKLTVAKASKKICKVSKGKLVALKRGNCSVTVSVTPAKTKKVKKPKTIKQSTIVLIS